MYSVCSKSSGVIFRWMLLRQDWFLLSHETRSLVDAHNQACLELDECPVWQINLFIEHLNQLVIYWSIKHSKQRFELRVCPYGTRSAVQGPTPTLECTGVCWSNLLLAKVAIRRSHCDGRVFIFDEGFQLDSYVQVTNPIRNVPYL